MKKSLLIWSIIILTTAVILLAWGIYRFNFMNHSKPIQTEIITDPKNASYEINGQLITFKNGKSELDVADNLNTKIVTSYFGNEAKGDLNKDGQEDVAFILTQDTGGSGIFYYIAVALAKDKSYEGLNAILLGDRIAPQTTEFRDGQIIVNYADRKAGEAMTVSPSLGISKYFQVINNRLVGVEAPAQIANPASVNCTKLGGKLVIQKRGDGGEYGLCYFEDNRACEEWALMRGDCPNGGVKTTGYDTIDQNYCAWSGGQTFAVPDSVCTFKDGSKCSTVDFYNGKCPTS